jgi:hypothetical protein
MEHFVYLMQVQGGWEEIVESPVVALARVSRFYFKQRFLVKF